MIHAMRNGKYEKLPYNESAHME